MTSADEAGSDKPSEGLASDPVVAEFLADELALAGLPSAADELGHEERIAIAAVDRCLRAVRRAYADSPRPQTERRAYIAALAAELCRAGTTFHPGDVVTVDECFVREPDRLLGRVLAVADRTVTVAWDSGRAGRIDAGGLRHDHC